MKIFVYIILLLVVQSCDMNKLPPKEFNYEHSRIYKKSNTDTWNRMNDFLTKRKVDIKIIDKNEGIIHFDIKIPDSLVYKYTDYTRSGYYNEFINVVGSVYVLLKQIDDYTKVDVMITYSGNLEYKVVWFKGQTTERETIKQNTTGMLEKEILDYISRN